MWHLFSLLPLRVPLYCSFTFLPIGEGGQANQRGAGKKVKKRNPANLSSDYPEGLMGNDFI